MCLGTRTLCICCVKCVLCVSTCYTRVGWWWGGPRLQCRAESSRRREIGLEQTHYGKQLPGRGSRPAGPAASRLGGSSPACKNVRVSNPRKGLPGPGRLRGAAVGQQPLLLPTPHCLSPSPRPPRTAPGVARSPYPLGEAASSPAPHMPALLAHLTPPAPAPAPARRLHSLHCPLHSN